MKWLKILPVVLCLIFSLNAYAKKQRNAEFKTMAGANIPSAGMALDVSYDAATDGIIPGYKLVNVAITNNSIDIIQLDKEGDKWTVVDLKGGKHKAVIDLRKSDPESFSKLPAKLRGLIEYPILIQVGETKVFDLLVKDSVRLDTFRSAKFESSTMQKNFEIVAQD